jgi:hypothetical protein
MASLTVNGVPDELMEQLRKLAEQEQRSLSQQVILLLEELLMQRRPGLVQVLSAFQDRYGPSSLDDEVFADLRSQDQGRNVAIP